MKSLSPRVAFGPLGCSGSTFCNRRHWVSVNACRCMEIIDHNEDLHATGGDIALPLWVDFMRDVVQLRPEYGGSSFVMPKGLTQVVIDPETGMAAGDYCPQRESAVVPTSAATFVKCFKHEPMQTMYAMNDVHESAPYETTIEAAITEPEIKADINTDTRHIVIYEDYSDGDELNIRRPTTPSEQPPPPPATRRRVVEESDLDGYEKLKKPE